MGISPTNPKGANELRADVVVIGAGLAGLSAARILTASDIDVVVLEARNRVGGRVYTRPASDGTLLDLGAQWMGPTQDRLAALAAEVGVSTFPSYDTGDNIEYRNGQRTTYSGAIPAVDPMVTMEVIEKMLDLNIMASEVPLDTPWTAPNAAILDAQTVATWMEANIQSEGARNLLTLAVQAVFSAEPRDLSLLHFLFYIHSGGSLNSLLSVTKGAQESRFAGGAQLVANRVAEALGPRVVLNAPVHIIRQDDAGVRVESDAMTIAAQRAIVAIPPALACRLRYSPPLPALRDQLTQRMPMGTVIKVHCLYETPFWRREGLTGQVTSDTGIIRITNEELKRYILASCRVSSIEIDRLIRWLRSTLEGRAF